MTNMTPAATDDLDDLTFEEAESLVSREQHKATIAKIAELRRQADAAKARAAKAQSRFEEAIVLTVTAKPTREDWYDHPGTLPRKTVMLAGQLNTMQLHRIMERYRRTPKRRAARKR